MPKKKLVVLIPAFNEEKTIAAVIKAIPRRIKGIGPVKVLVVNDGSLDRTVERARKAAADKIVSHPVNRGLGRAFQSGMDAALEMGASLIVNIDADGQFNPKDIEKLIKPILLGKADVVTCSRFKDHSLRPKMPLIKYLGNRAFTRVINFFTRSSFTDTQCGFRAYSKEAALRLNLFAKFTYTQEVLIDLLAKGLRIGEVACKVQGERKGQSRVVKHWWAYGIKALVIVVRTLRDYKPLQFFGSAGLVTGGLGVLYGLVLWWISASQTVANVPVWQVILAILLILAGLLLVVLALVADMLDRQRRLQEEILYKLKKKEIS